MTWSTIIGLVWVFFVSIFVRGWATSLHVADIIFWVGVAFIVVRILEWLLIVRGGLKSPRNRSAD